MYSSRRTRSESDKGRGDLFRRVVSISMGGILAVCYGCYCFFGSCTKAMFEAAECCAVACLSSLANNNNKEGSSCIQSFSCVSVCSICAGVEVCCCRWYCCGCCCFGCSLQVQCGRRRGSRFYVASHARWAGGPRNATTGIIQGASRVA